MYIRVTTAHRRAAASHLTRWVIMAIAIALPPGCQTQGGGGGAAADNNMDDGSNPDGANLDGSGDSGSQNGNADGTGGGSDNADPGDNVLPGSDAGPGGQDNAGSSDGSSTGDGPGTSDAGASIKFTPLNEGDTAFEQQGRDCLAEINSLGGIGADLLKSLATANVTVKQTNETSAATISGEPGDMPKPENPVTITIGNINGNYGCGGAPKDWCATLLHELQHAADFKDGLSFERTEDEARGSRAENWYLANKGECQRDCYDDDPTATPFPEEFDVIWDIGIGECQLALTIINETPQWIVVRGDGERLNCGGEDPDFGGFEHRDCTIRFERDPNPGNPYAVKRLTMIAYYPGGDPTFVAGGTVEWYNEQGERELCNNVYSEYCQILMGEDGEFPTFATHRSRTIRVRYVPPAE